MRKKSKAIRWLQGLVVAMVVVPLPACSAARGLMDDMGRLFNPE